MGKMEKLIAKIESKPIRTDISYTELERYYNHFGYFAKKLITPMWRSRVSGETKATILESDSV